MRRRITISALFLLAALTATAQLNIKAFGARESYADNSKYIQKAIDSAAKSKKDVIIPLGEFRTGPLQLQIWNGEDYRFVTVKILGQGTMWDLGRSTLVAIDPTAPLLSIQKGKGCIIDGVTFKGLWRPPGSPYKTELAAYRDPGTGDSRYSPHTAIAIDAFCYFLPPDSGYPTLRKFYRGGESRGGSTGLIIKNCIFNGFTVGAITSPNGYTQNAELITFENIQITNCKIGFAGCQAQEKLNRIINVGAWGTTHTVFDFLQYGQGTPGNWSISWVNVAGDVNQILNRNSNGYFPLYMDHIYAESIFQFGYWESFVGDAMTEFVLDFKYPEELGELPKAQFFGGGVMLRDGVTRYYGNDQPIIFAGRKKHENTRWFLDHVKITEGLGVPPQLAFTYDYSLPDGITEADCQPGELRDGQIVNNSRSGRMALFLDNSNTYLGYAILDGTRIRYKSLTLKDGPNYKITIIP